MIVGNLYSNAAAAQAITGIGASFVGDQEVDLLRQIFVTLGGGGAGGGGIVVTVSNGSSFSIPTFNSQAFTYYGGTNNIQTQTFKMNGATVATLTFVYVNGAASDDDLILTITQS